MRTNSIAVLLGLALLACDGSNPVAPVGVGEPAPATGYTISLSATPSTAFAGLTQVTITLKVVPNGNGSAASGTISVSTSLGTLMNGSDTGSLLSVSWAGEDLTLTLDPGEVAGMAEVLARLDDSAGSLMVEVKDPGDPPVAEFDFEIIDKEVVFTDKSSEGPTAWYWFFDDEDDTTCGETPTKDAPAECTAQNPTHIYAGDPKSHKVTLTVTNVDSTVAKTVAESPVEFQSSLTRFVTIEGSIFILSVEPHSGTAEGGDQVTITGSGGFRAPLRVFFGNKLSNDVTVVSGEEIKAVTPIGDLQQIACDSNGDGEAKGLIFADTPVQLVVELDDGTKETLDNAFTYLAPTGTDNTCVGDF